MNIPKNEYLVEAVELPVYGIVLNRFMMVSALALLTLTLCTAPIHADGGAFVVGADGELLKIQNGLYGELFPEGGEADPKASVLALDSIVGESLNRFLVPQTESSWTESSARLITDERAGVSYLLWEARINGVHPLLRLVAFDGEAFGEVQEITAGVFATKGEPKLRVTHDSHGEGEEARERTVLHVSWWEEHQSAKEKRYASLVLEDGNFVDADVVVNLSALLSAENFGTGTVSPLDALIRMQAGPHKDVVILGFSDPRLGRVVSLEIEVLPQALSRLSDLIRAELIALGPNAGSIAAYAAVQRAIDEMADEFHSVGLELIRQDLMAYLDQLMEEGPSDLPLSSKMGGRVIWIGAKIGRTGLANPGEPQLLEISGSEGRSHHLAVTQTATWDLPEVGATSPQIFLSQDGSEALVAWIGEGGEAVYYRVSEGGSWGEVQSLQLQSGIDAEQALSLLEKRALDR